MKHKKNNSTPNLPTLPLSKPSKPTTLHHPTTSFTSCFRPSTIIPTLEYPCTPPQTTTTTTTTNPNITTSLYHTHLGIFSITWSRSFLSRSFHLHLHNRNSNSSSTSFHLSLKPFLFFSNKQGIKKLPLSPSKFIWVFWDLTNATFGSGPEPISGFYVAVLYEGKMTLLVGDMEKQAFDKTEAKIMQKKNEGVASLALRREHVVGKNKFYTTKTDFGGKMRIISIELNEQKKKDPSLVIRFDQKKALEVKHLRWKFRGSERMEVDGHPIRFSWDVHSWLLQESDDQDDGYALFTFRFEKQGNGETGEVRETGVIWSDDSWGLNYEREKMKGIMSKKKIKKTKITSPSLSSSSLSSVSSGCSSVLEWESVEENELKGPNGFSLLVYAWKG